MSQPDNLDFMHDGLKIVYGPPPKDVEYLLDDDESNQELLVEK